MTKLRELDDNSAKMTEEQVREAREYLEAAADLFLGTDLLEPRSSHELNLGESSVSIIKRIEDYWDHLEFSQNFPRSFGRSGFFMSPNEVKKEDAEISRVLDDLENQE